MLLALALVAWITPGCALGPELPPLTCPGRGGPNFSEYRTAHLDVRTDVETGDAAAIVPALEREYQLIARLMQSELPGVTPPSNRVQVVLFRDHADVEALDPNTLGFFHVDANAWDSDPAVVLSVHRTAALRRLFQHEITHRFVAHYLPTAPAWLNEGLAQLWSTAQVEGDRIVVGKYDDELHHYGYQPNVRELFAADEWTFIRESSYYTEAWALVHMLQSEHSGYRARFERYLAQLGDGLRADLAWQGSFTGIDLDALERALNRYHVVLRYDTRTVGGAPAPSTSIAVNERKMSDEEVHLLWVSLRPWVRGNGAQLERDLTQAKIDPQPADYFYWAAGVWSAFGQNALARDLIATGIAKSPEDRRLLRGSLLFEVTPALGERLARVATDGVDFMDAAAGFAAAGRFSEARELAGRAVKADPGCTQCWMELGWLARDSGDLRAAVLAMQRAAWLSPDRGDLLEGLVGWIARAADAHLPRFPDPVGEMVPSLFVPSEGVELRARVIDQTSGAPLAGVWVHAGGDGGRFALVKSDEQGGVRLKIRPGLRLLTFLPGGARISDRRWVHVPPSSKPIDLGAIKLARGRIPDPMIAIDGIDPVNRDGRAYVKRVGPDSAASKAGVRAGEPLLRINGEDVHDLGPNAINLILSGPPGKSITVELGPAPSRTVSFALAPLLAPEHPAYDSE